MIKIKSWYICCVLVVVAQVLFACEKSQSYSLVDKIPIPDNAVSVKKSYIFGSKLHQQISYKVNARYPDDTYLIDQERYLNNNKWLRCSSNSDSWGSYIDSTKAEEILVFERLRHWVNYENKQLLIISANYVSSDFISDKPDADDMSILVYVEQFDSYDLLVANLDEIGICENKKY